MVQDIARNIMNSLVTVNFDEASDENIDGVYLYASDLLKLGVIWIGFHDAIREGDGDR